MDGGRGEGQEEEENPATRLHRQRGETSAHRKMRLPERQVPEEMVRSVILSRQSGKTSGINLSHQERERGTALQSRPERGGAQQRPIEN